MNNFLAPGKRGLGVSLVCFGDGCLVKGVVGLVSLFFQEYQACLDSRLLSTSKVFGNCWLRVFGRVGGWREL